MLIITTQCFPPTMGGIESLVYHLANEISKQGEEVWVYADAGPNQSGSWSDSSQTFKILRSGGLKPMRRRAKARSIKLTAQHNNHPVILADTWKSLEFLDTTFAARTACLAHGSEFPRQPSRQKHKRICRALAKADVIIANSAYTASRVALYTSNKHIAVVHPGIDEPAQDTILYEQTRSIIGGNKPVLITIARLEKRKGHQQVIDLLPALIKDFPDLVYIIVGEGPCHSGLVSQVKSHALQDHVQFVGTLMGAEKNAYLNNSDVFVMPGIEAGDDIEGYGIAYIEAGYFGVPSIASELGGASDAVDHEKTGLVCVPADMSCLERSLRKLISDKDCRNLLGNGARRKARESLWPARIKDYTKLFFET